MWTASRLSPNAMYLLTTGSEPEPCIDINVYFNKWKLIFRKIGKKNSIDLLPSPNSHHIIYAWMLQASTAKKTPKQKETYHRRSWFIFRRNIFHPEPAPVLVFFLCFSQNPSLKIKVKMKIAPWNISYLWWQCRLQN